MKQWFLSHWTSVYEGCYPTERWEPTIIPVYCFETVSGCGVLKAHPGGIDQTPRFEEILLRGLGAQIWTGLT